VARILYFSNDYCTHDHRFLAAIQAGGHEVFHLRLEANLRQTEDRPVPEGVEIVPWAGGRGKFRWRNLPRYLASLRGVIKRLQPDLIHAGPIQTCAFLAILSGFRPILTMSWGYDLMQDVHRNRWWGWVTGYVLKRSTYFISDANVTRDKAVVYGMEPERTVVFPWGVDLEHFMPGPRETPLGKGVGFTLFCNRSWEPRYGVDDLASAFVKAARIEPELNLILLAEGSQGARIRQILLNGGMRDRVTFGGQVSQNELPRWYHWADVYISPSHVDGSSVSLMEALACGLPCLVSDIPANREWVREGENGWFFPDGDIGALAAKILMAAKQRRSLAKIGRAARKTAEDRADWNKYSGILIQTYRNILRLKPTRRSLWYSH
jgi:glycosyltransferase involved in cell wall biosynthesis